jgi:hypothetical protein
MPTYSEDGALSVFEPEMVQVIAQAYEECCVMLRVFAGDEQGKQVIAMRVLELARSGIMDPALLRDLTLRQLRIAA